MTILRLVLAIAPFLVPTSVEADGLPLQFESDVLPHLPKSTYPTPLPVYSITTKTIADDRDGSPAVEFTSSYKRSRRAGSHSVTRADKLIQHGYNPWYYFEVERPHTASEWKLSRLVMSDDDSFAGYVEATNTELMRPLSTPPISLAGAGFDELSRLPSFRVTQCERVKTPDGDRIRLAVSVRATKDEWSKSKSGTLLKSVRTATMLIDPQRWVILEGSTTYDNPVGPVTITGTLTGSGVGPDGRFVRTVNRSESFQDIPGKPRLVGMLSVSETECSTPDDIPDREFMLTAYGLPEPRGIEVPREGPPLYVWLILAGVGLAVVGYVARRRVLRKSTAVA